MALHRRAKTGLLRVDHAAIARDAHLDGKYLLRTSDDTLTPADLATAYKLGEVWAETVSGKTTTHRNSPSPINNSRMIS